MNVRFIACLCLGAAMLGGCSDDPASAGGTETGAYLLAQVNSQDLPFSLTTNQGAVVMEAGSLTLPAAPSAGATYAAVLSGTVNGEYLTLFDDFGTYTRSGSRITFQSTLVPGALLYHGTLRGNFITVTIPGLVVGTTGTFDLRFQK